jgi:hypothetical protein
MRHDRRTILAAIGFLLPFGFGERTRAAAPVGPPTSLGFRSFEKALRETLDAPQWTANRLPCCRVQVGHSDLLLSGVQGCHNGRPFAGFPIGHLRIIRIGSEPGPNLGGVRLYICTLDVVVTGGRDCGPSRPFDFAAVPPAPVLLSGRD